MLVFVGNSASGKTYITDYLRKKNGYKKIVTYTTRAIRDGEVDGEDYNFVTKKQFQKLINKKFFFEFSEYAGNFYGSHFEDEEIESDKTYIILEMKGAIRLKDYFGSKITIVSIWTPKEIIFQRLAKRKATKEDIEKRLREFYTLDELFEISDNMFTGMTDPRLIQSKLENLN